MSEVVLTPTEIMEAAFCGVLRVCKVLQEDRGETCGGVREEAWPRHIEGAMGERVLAKHLNIYWHGVGNICGTDVGEATEVRTTKHSNGCLILHKNDADDKKYWLVTGAMGNYTVRGWMLGRDGKQDKYWSDPQETDRWAFFVPQSELSQ